MELTERDRSTFEILSKANPFAAFANFGAIVAHPLFRPGIFAIISACFACICYASGSMSTNIVIAGIFLGGVQALIMNELAARPVKIRTMLLAGVMCLTVGMIFFFILDAIVYSIYPEVADGRQFFRDTLNMFISVAVIEELTKALPVFWIGFYFARKKARLLTPLSAMVLASASGASFAVLEHLVAYMDCSAPSVAQVVNLITRVSLQLTGHITYSCIFGFFIGLAFQYQNLVLAFPGLLLASLLHSLWNSLLMHFMPGALVLAFACLFILVACVIKARRLEYEEKPLLAWR